MGELLIINGHFLVFLGIPIYTIDYYHYQFRVSFLQHRTNSHILTNTNISFKLNTAINPLKSIINNIIKFINLYKKEKIHVIIGKCKFTYIKDY